MTKLRIRTHFSVLALLALVGCSQADTTLGNTGQPQANLDAQNAQGLWSNGWPDGWPQPEPPPPCPDNYVPIPGQCREECMPPQPPQDAAGCTYEVRVSGVTVVNGQGLSEGDLELSGSFAIDNSSFFTHYWNAPSELAPGQNNSTDLLLGTISVPLGDVQWVTVTGTFTEDDDGGGNGQNDTGMGQSLPYPLECPATAKGSVPSMPIPMFGNHTGESNGIVGFTVEFILVNADGDTAENEDDYTRTICEEMNKGQLGEAVVLYEEYDQSGVTALAQAVAINAANIWDSDYDGLALIYTENGSNNRFGIDMGLKEQADLLLLPTMVSLDTAFKTYTRKGYQIDLYVLSHAMTREHALGECAAYPFSLDSTGAPLCNDSYLSAGDLEDDYAGDLIPGAGAIYESEMLWWWDPSRMGTLEVPLRMSYMGNCYGEDFADTLTKIGAKVHSGTKGVNVYPQKLNEMAQRWRAGDPYLAAMVASESNLGAQAVSDFFIRQRGKWLLCPDVFSSLPCAIDFWTGNPKGYLQLDYDASLTGRDNMAIGTTRVMTGLGTISRASSLTWK